MTPAVVCGTFEAGGGPRTETRDNWLRLDLLPELQQQKKRRRLRGRSKYGRINSPRRRPAFGSTSR